jgi:GntR family transcriptional regulator of arabinose operon
MLYKGKKVEKAANFIHNYIKDNHLKKNDKILTEGQIVKETGFSRITIRRAFSNIQSQGLIFSVQGGGYYVSGTSPEKSVSYIPFILHNDVNIVNSLDIIQGAQSFLSSVSCRLSPLVTNYDAEQEKRLITELYEEGVRCIIVMPFSSIVNSQFYFELMRKGVNFVFVDIKPNISCNFIESDNFYGGFLATEHLIKMGHKKILVFYHSAIDSVSSLQSRFAGYEFAMHKYNIPMPNKSIIYSDFSHYESVLKELFSSEEAPKAIFALNGNAAIYIANFVQNNKELLPDGFAFIGFDNFESVARYIPSISTVAQPFYQIGAEAAKMAYELITKGQTGFKSYILPVELIVRDSTDPKHIYRNSIKSKE